MVRRFQRFGAIAGAVLLVAGQARGAAPTDSRVEPDAYQSAEADRWIVLRQAGAEGDEACDAFVAADVWEFDGCYGLWGSHLGRRRCRQRCGGLVVISGWGV